MGRLARTRKAWVIIVGVLVTPALYAWFNINAFWDPYASTGDIRVAVVNLDRGADSELTGPVDVGAQVVDQLKANDQLGWTFMDEKAAHRAVESADAYAAIVIPADFSEELLSITSGEFTQPALQYYVNEKSSAIAPKITDVGASTLDKQITSAFVEQVSKAATTAVKDAGIDVEERLTGAQNDTVAAFDDATKKLDAAGRNVTGMQTSLASSRDSLHGAQDTLRDVDGVLADVQSAIGEAQSVISDAQGVVVGFTDAASNAYVTGTALLADASASANVAVTRLTGAFDDASVRVDTAIADVTRVAEANADAIATMREVVDDPATDPAVAERLNTVIADLEQRNQTDQQLLSDLGSLNDAAASTSQTISDAAAAVTAATKNANAAAGGARSALTDTVPELNRAMSALSASAGQFSAAVGAQRGQVTQAVALLGDLDAQLASTSDALGAFGKNIAGIEDGLKTARTDVAALGAADAWKNLQAVTGLDPGAIADFIATPVEVAEHVVYPVATYGSAMAALFTNLSLWIGAFVLMVIFKIEVDTEDVEGITVGEAYMGRFWLFAALASLQALIVSIGNLVIGVQTVSPIAFVGTAVLISWAYISIIYALSVAFGHVGRGLCILLVIMQIPGASGLYPIEMMPDFFRGIYPFLPFTYGIDALRETIAGFYDGTYWRCLAALAIFVAVAFLIGLVLRRRLANLNMLFNRQIASTDLLIGEKVQVTAGGYRLADVYRALGDRAHFRDDIARGNARFRRRYPTLLRIAALTTVAGIAVIAVIAWVIPGAKAWLLGVWVLWLLLAMALLVTLEYVRESHERSRQIAEADDDTLREYALDGGLGRHAAMSEPATVTTATAVLPQVRRRGTAAADHDHDHDHDHDGDIDSVMRQLFDDPDDPPARGATTGRDDHDDDRTKGGDER